jgi:enoyl-CoA hydratase/carnithine racemase
VGLSRAKDLVLTGRVVGMEEADRIGLLHRTAPAAQAEAVALELATQIAEARPDGLRRLKEMFRELGGEADRVAYENDLLMDFQRTGAGLPRAGGR